MRLFALLLALFLVAVTAATSFAAADPYAPVKKKLAAAILRDMARNKVMGVSIALVDDQSLVWAQGFGYADAAAKIPAGPDTVYRVGSISKVVTSTYVMQLAGAGRIAIDADVRRYVPEFSIRDRFPDTPPITPRMLMTHHSGLPSDVVAGMWTEHPMTLAQYIPTLARESMASPPVEQFRYSNVGFSLLGRMVEEVEGLPFSEAMRRGLLEPLGMASSSYVMTEFLAPRYATGYKDGKEAPRPTLRDQPAGSLFSTAVDLGRFVSAVFTGGAGVVDRTALASMLTVQYPGLPLDFGHEMGLGWMLSGLTLADGRPLAWHGGTVVPFQAFMAIDPRSKLGVVILANSEEASRFNSELAVQALELALEAKTGRKPPRKQKAEKPAPIHLPVEELAQVAGDYATFGAQLGAVRLDDSVLKMWLVDRMVELEPVGPGKFLPRKEVFFGLATRAMPDLSLEYRRVAGRDVLALLGQAMPVPFEKIPQRPMPPAWKARLGKYATDVQGSGISYRSLELAEQDGLLVARIAIASGAPGEEPLQAVFPLIPVSDEEAVIGGIGTGTGAVVRAETGGIYHSGYDFRPER